MDVIALRKDTEIVLCVCFSEETEDKKAFLSITLVLFAVFSILFFNFFIWMTG